jgi:hypothetical protein
MLAIVCALVAPLTMGEPRLFFDHGAANPQPRVEFRFTGSQDGELHGAVETPSYHADLSVRAQDGGRAIELTVRYRKPVSVQHEWIELVLPADSARALGRDGALHELPPLLRLDAWSPKYLEASTAGGTVVLTAGDEFEGMAMERRPDRVLVTLELDDVANHPFHYESRCRSNWHLRMPSRDHSARFRAPGEVASYHLWLTRAAEHPQPLTKQRFPDGQRAAFALTDHADQSSVATLRALLYGSSADPPPQGQGILGHHLRMTKALFFDSAGAARPQLEDPAMQALARALVQAGSEVIPHSATPRRDSRAVTEQALRFFQTLGAHTWIDHQVETNCEAFTDRGWKIGDAFYIADLLVKYGIRYVWSGRDPQAPGGGINLLAPDRPELRTAWLYGHGPDAAGGPRVYLWRSEWAFLDEARFYATYSNPALDRLIAERGVHVAHTYLETLHDVGPMRARRVLVRADDGSVRTAPAFEHLLGELERRQAAGELWVAPIGALADHVLAMSQVELRYQADGSVILRNQGATPVQGATFTAAETVEIDGAPPQGSRVEADGVTFWLDLQPGRDYRVTSADGFVKSQDEPDLRAAGRITPKNRRPRDR